MNPLFFNPNYYNKTSISKPTCGRNIGCGLGAAGHGCRQKQCTSCPFNNDNVFNLGYGQCRMLANQQSRQGCLYGAPADCPFKR
jgi:hypothetical protein